MWMVQKKSSFQVPCLLAAHNFWTIIGLTFSWNALGCLDFIFFFWSIFCFVGLPNFFWDQISPAEWESCEGMIWDHTNNIWTLIHVQPRYLHCSLFKWTNYRKPTSLEGLLPTRLLHDSGFKLDQLIMNAEAMQMSKVAHWFWAIVLIFIPFSPICTPSDGVLTSHNLLKHTAITAAY